VTIVHAESEKEIERAKHGTNTRAEQTLSIDNSTGVSLLENNDYQVIS